MNNLNTRTNSSVLNVEIKASTRKTRISNWQSYVENQPEMATEIEKRRVAIAAIM